MVFPTHWDERHLAARRGGTSDVEVVFAEPSDADCPDSFDVLAFIDRTVAEQRGRIQGVFSSSDYPGATVAAAVATALGRPKRPDGGPPAIEFPCFVKPVKGAFSVLARRIADQAELERFLDQAAVRDFTSDYMRIFNELVSRYGRFQLERSWIMAAGRLRSTIGQLEGF